MTHTINTNAIVTKYEAFLKAGTSYGDALKQAAAQLGTTPCPTLMQALAAVHAKHYKCNFTWNKSGRAVFHTGAESTRDTRHYAAQKSWERNVGVFFTTGEPKVSKHVPVDPVAKLLKAYAGLTTAQKRAFLRGI